MADKEFRDSVLAGAGRSERDTPLVRARAARDYFARELDAARAAEVSAETALAKALDQADAARVAEVDAERQRVARTADLEAAVRLVAAVEAGEDMSEHTGVPAGAVFVQAGLASATGVAS